MKRGKESIKMAALISVLIALVHGTIEGANTQHDNVVDPTHKSDTIKGLYVAANELKEASYYIESGKYFRFFKNLLGSSNISAEHIIVEESSFPTILNPITCVQIEEKDDRNPTASTLLKKEMQKIDKEILIFSNVSANRKPLNRRIEAAKDLNTEQKTFIKEITEILNTVIDINICKSYIECLKNSKNVKAGNLSFVNNLQKDVHLDILSKIESYQGEKLFTGRGSKLLGHKLIQILKVLNNNLYMSRMKTQFNQCSRQINEILERNTIEKNRDDSVCLYINKINKIFGRIEQEVRIDLMVAQFNQDFSTYKESSKSIVEITNENIKVCLSILDICKENIGENSANYEDKKENLKEILIQVQELFKRYENEDDLLSKLKYAKEEIFKIFSDILFASNVYATNSTDLQLVKNILKNAIYSICDVMLTKYITWFDYRKSDTISLEIEKNKAYISNSSIFKSNEPIVNLLKFFEDFLYTSDTEQSLIKEISQLNIEGSILPKHLLDIDPAVVCSILEHTLQIYQHINALQKYSEIWNNPAILYLQPNRSSKSELSCYIIYKSSKDRNIYIKLIDFTNANLEAFKNATTSEDIEKVKGYYSLCWNMPQGKTQIPTLNKRNISLFSKN